MANRKCQDWNAESNDIKRKAILDMADDILESERYQKEFDERQPNVKGDGGMVKGNGKLTENVKADKILGICPNCSGKNLYWYDGCLGYEAIVCRDCGKHFCEDEMKEC
jgi:hypothetical protein